jgi:pyruvate, water dikinase
MRAVTLDQATTEQEFGGKAVNLGEAVRAGLPVPPGCAFDVEMVEAVRDGATWARETVKRALGTLGGRVAVRSSAVGEDAADASFAGQHLTILNVTSPEAALDAVGSIRDSAHTATAGAYRRQRGIGGAPRMAVVMQALLSPDAAGVLFTRNPVTGADERVIEASWGLGEAVVGGIVVPDVYRIDRRGTVLEATPGEKHMAYRPLAEGGLREEELDAASSQALCLTPADLAALHELAARCEGVYGPGLDIEWVVASGHAYLLQVRPITTRQAA